MTSASASSLPTEFLSASLQKVIESKLPDNIWIKLNIPIKNIIETINGILEVGYEYDSDDTGETFLLELLEFLKHPILQYILLISN